MYKKIDFFQGEILNITYPLKDTPSSTSSVISHQPRKHSTAQQGHFLTAKTYWIESCIAVVMVCLSSDQSELKFSFGHLDQVNLIAKMQGINNAALLTMLNFVTGNNDSLRSDVKVYIAGSVHERAALKACSDDTSSVRESFYTYLLSQGVRDANIKHGESTHIICDNPVPLPPGFSRTNPIYNSRTTFFMRFNLILKINFDTVTRKLTFNDEIESMDSDRDAHDVFRALAGTYRDKNRLRVRNTSSIFSSLFTTPYNILKYTYADYIKEYPVL